MQQNQIQIYWEKQGSDKLCGIHALNSALQGPFYNEFQLAEIARELDDQEKALLGGENSGSSNNVANDGNFSIQVLSEALKRTAQLTCTSIDGETLKNKDLSEEHGFICNSSAHWLTIRKVNGKWYNLNSTNDDGPELVSDFYLSAFLNSVRENGYTIFVVQGQFPQYDKSFFGETRSNQRFFTDEQCEVLHQQHLKNKDYKLNIGGTDEKDLEKAIKNSLKDHSMKNEEDELKQAMEASLADQDKKEEPEEPKFNAFQGQGIQLQGGQASGEIEAYFAKFQDLNPGDDPELSFAIRLSMEETVTSIAQEGSEDSITLNIRFPDGKNKKNTFKKSSLIEVLYDFVYVKNEDPQVKKFRVSSKFPVKPFLNFQQTLQEAGIEDQDGLIVESL